MSISTQSMVKAITALDRETLAVFAYLSCVNRSSVTRVRYSEIAVAEIDYMSAELGLTPVELFAAINLLRDLDMLDTRDDEEWVAGLNAALDDAQ